MSPSATVVSILSGVLLLTACGGAPPTDAAHDHGATHGLANREPSSLTWAGPARVRKNVRDLSAAERKEFVDAVLKLKAMPSPYDPTLSYYDQFVVWHLALYRCDPLGHHGMMGHGGPGFLPWHRVYLVLLEKAFHEVTGKHIAVPYWDWTDPWSTPVVFSKDFMGSNGDPNDGFAVKDGPFRKGNWKLRVHPIGAQWAVSSTHYITRNFGSLGTAPALPTASDVAEALLAPFYDVAPYDTTSNPRQSFRNALEGFRDYPGPNTMECGPDGVMTLVPLNAPKMHNQVHGWVGGSLGVRPDGLQLYGTMVLPTSPNDPVFFLHHANVDRLWAQWQERNGIDTYQPVSVLPGSNIDDPMAPYDTAGLMVTPRSVSDHDRLNYRYQ